MWLCPAVVISGLFWGNIEEFEHTGPAFPRGLYVRVVVDGMAIAEQACYTLLTIPDDGEPPTELSLKQDFRKGYNRQWYYHFETLALLYSEKGNAQVKIKALKATIQMILAGEKLPSLLMPIIQYALPMDDHMLKKLLLIYFEIVPKTQPDGKLLHEMILVCDAYRRVRICGLSVRFSGGFTSLFGLN